MIKNDGGSAKNIVHDMDRAKERVGEDAMSALLDELHLGYERQYAYAVGRRFRADFAVWIRTARPHECLCVLIEIVGGVYPWQRPRKDGSWGGTPGAHGSVTGILADIERLNLATINGWFMLRFSPGQVNDGTARRVLERLISATEPSVEKAE